jgi:hypothetical protein
VFAAVYCVAGWYTKISSCVKCDIGKYSLAGTQTSCSSCVAGKYTKLIGTSSCTNCPANSQSDSGMTVCKANLGYYNLDASVNLKAYYPINSGVDFLVDVTGLTGNLVASPSSPSANSGGWGASVGAFLTGSSNQFFTLPSFKLPVAFSICSWFWVSPSITRNWNRIWDFGIGAGTDSNIIASIYWTSTSIRIDVLKGSTVLRTAQVDNAAIASVWTHVCMTLSGRDGVVWVNGNGNPIVFQTTSARDATQTLTTNYIGKSKRVEDSPWWGGIDDFRIYHKALTSNEVAALYSFVGDTYSPMIILPCISGGISQCTRCPSGYRSSGGNCHECLSGTYSLEGATTCTSCPINSFSASMANTCTACATGKYLLSASSTSCTSCAAGGYLLSASSTSCTSCAAGKYLLSASSTSCTSCAAGKYSSVVAASSSSVCTDCTTIENAHLTESGEGRITDCPFDCNGGFVKSGDFCVLLPAGPNAYFTGVGTIAGDSLSCPFDCSVGYTKSDYSCVMACSNGNYFSNGGCVPCRTCTSGHWLNGCTAANAGDCIVCDNNS